MNETVQANSYLTLHYRFTLDSGAAKGQIFIDTFTEKPGTLQMGIGQWSMGLEKPLVGRKVGDTFTYKVPAADAYGDKNPELLQYVSMRLLKEQGNFAETYAVGDILSFQAPNGLLYSGVVSAVEPDKVLMDFNHPLAGMDVQVDVSLIGVL